MSLLPVVHGRGTTAAKPAAAAANEGYLYFDTTLTRLERSNGTTWDVIEASAGAAGALVFLEAKTASASASLDFTTFISSTYDTYVIEGTELVLATNTAHLHLEMGTGAGPTWDTGNTYEWSREALTTGGTGSGTIDFASTGLCRVFATAANAAGYGFGSFSLKAKGLQSTALRKTVYGTVYYVTSTGPAAVIGTFGMQWTTTATAVTGLRFIASAGNITSGIIRIYGVAKS